MDGMLMSNEKQDVVEYRQNVFLLVIQDLESKTRKQGRDGPGEEDEPTDKPHTVLSFRDESTLCANDLQSKRWFCKSDRPRLMQRRRAVPY